MGLLSLSAGVMVTYAGYLSEKSNLVTSTAWVAWKKHTVRQL